MRSDAGSRTALATTFVSMAQRYWVGLHPQIRRELAYWRRRAAEIPDPVLRDQALRTHRFKTAHAEGAAAFAVLVAPARRPGMVRAVIAYQAMYDYLDTISEQEGADRFANSHQLHRALVAVFEPTTSHVDYYALNPRRRDGGYLREFVEVCHVAATSLPSYERIAPLGRRAAVRAMESQAINHAVMDGTRLSEGSVARWALAQVPADGELRWWEIVGAAGSSLVVFALLAAASREQMQQRELLALERLYFPWAGTLLALVDSVNDQGSDAQHGTHSLVGRYDSPAEAAGRLGAIASRSLELTRDVPQPREHALIIAAMVSQFVAEPEAARPEARAAQREVLLAMGEVAWLPLLLLRARRRITAIGG